MYGLLEEKCKPLIGVVHLPPLPGSYGYKRAPYPPLHGRKWTFEEILDFAVEEARRYEEAGFDGVIIENYGDRPYTIRVGTGQTAAMSRIVAEVKRNISIPLGVNMLRNSAYEAVYIAYISGAEMVRVNSICEHRLALEGSLEPAVHEIARAVSELDIYDTLVKGRLLILGDIDVKHSYPLASRYEAGQIVEDCLTRAGFPIHGIIVSGAATGEEPEVAYVEEIASPVRKYGAKIIIGSGISTENIANYWRLADAFIVGTSVKLGGITENRVSIEKARSLVRIVEQYRKTWPCHHGR